MTRALIVSLLLLLGGCSYTTERRGDSRFLTAEPTLKLGETTAADVAQALGPPDRITTWADRLWFYYAYNHVSETGFTLSYYVNWFTRSSKGEIDRFLVLAFDEDDTLVYHGMSRGAFDRSLLGIPY